jgi:hypothetical protein
MESRRTLRRRAFQARLGDETCVCFDSGTEGNGYVCPYAFHSKLPRETARPRPQFSPEVASNPSGAIRGLVLKHVLISDGSRSRSALLRPSLRYRVVEPDRRQPGRSLIAPGQQQTCRRATTETFTAAIIFLIGCALRTASSSHERGMQGMQLLRAGPAMTFWPALLQIRLRLAHRRAFIRCPPDISHQ